MHFAAIAVAFSFTGDSRFFPALLSNVTSIAVIDNFQFFNVPTSAGHLPSSTFHFYDLLFVRRRKIITCGSSAASFLII
jgi:hypothetical protein